MAKVRVTRYDDKHKTVYRIYCDNHPQRKAAWAFTEAATGKRVGLCRSCFEERRDAALSTLRQERIAAKKARVAKIQQQQAKRRK